MSTFLDFIAALLGLLFMLAAVGAILVVVGLALALTFERWWE